jgi:hypothetical protein
MAKNRVNTIDALALAIHALDVNTKVVKENDGSGLIPNTVYIRDYFGLNTEPATPTVLISSDLREQAETVHTWFKHSITMSLLTGGNVNDFQKTVAELVAEDTVSPARFGVLIWAPKLYRDQLARDEVKETVMHIGYRSNWIGKEKQSVAINFTLLEKRWHREYNTWTAFGHDEHNNLVRFMTSHENRCATGKIQGRVKQHRNEYYYGGAKITILNFVKAT